MTTPKDATAPLRKAANRSSDLTQQAGDLVGKSALVATHAALTLARGAVASADTAVRKYLPAGPSSARMPRKAKKARAKAKRKVRRAAGNVKRAAKSAIKSQKRRRARRNHG